MAEQNLVERLTARALALKPVRAFLLYSEHQGAMLADSITYRTLFSVFAGVFLGFSVLGLVLAGNQDALDAVAAAVDGVIPGLISTGSDSTGIIDLSNLKPTEFTIAGVVSIVGLLGAAIGAIGSTRTAMRAIAGTLADQTLWYWVILRNLALAIGIGVGLVASAGITFLGTAGTGIVLGWFGVASGSPLAITLGRVLGIVVVLALDTVIVAVLFQMLSGVKARPRQLWSGALLGGVGLIVLQQLSGLFVGGARSNPLLVTFASFIALLLWLNLSAQVVLLATAWIVTDVETEHDRVAAEHGATTFAQRRVQQAERGVRVATSELQAAREAERQEREAAAKASSA